MQCPERDEMCTAHRSVRVEVGNTSANERPGNHQRILMPLIYHIISRWKHPDHEGGLAASSRPNTVAVQPRRWGAVPEQEAQVKGLVSQAKTCDPIVHQTKSSVTTRIENSLLVQQCVGFVHPFQSPSQAAAFTALVAPSIGACPDLWLLYISRSKILMKPSLLASALLYSFPDCRVYSRNSRIDVAGSGCRDGSS